MVKERKPKKNSKAASACESVPLASACESVLSASACESVPSASAGESVPSQTTPEPLPLEENNDLQSTEVADDSVAEESDAVTTASKVHKKRGRKPKGGKIIITNTLPECTQLPEPNIILHLKCGAEDLNEPSFSCITDCGGIDNFQFEGHNLHYQQLPSNTITTFKCKTVSDDTADADSNDEQRSLWRKIRELTYNLHTNNIADKKSACFWCTCDFDNPPIFLPKHEINGTYYCYGCFCSPECATAFLLKEPIDSSSRFERYHLLNHIYCKIYDYKKNIKPAPDPFYTLSKYYGNLSIQEYRRLLKSERLLLVVDKPLSRTLPELHEDNDDFMSGRNTIPPASKFKLRRKAKQTKTDIMSETFNFEGNAK